MSNRDPRETACGACGSAGARRYQIFSEDGAEQERLFCVRCARAERKRRAGHPAPSNNTEGQTDGQIIGQTIGLTREEIIIELDRFFEAIGIFEICRQCHEQGTGCCPPTCRVIGAHGCDPHNKYGKTLFCATFVCGALLNAISECDAETGRAIKALKREVGPTEFHLYQMITRVPSGERELARPLNLPPHYPESGLGAAGPISPERGHQIREKLMALAAEVLEIRRHWHELEKREIP